jgi:thiamine pyrophosphokinase
MVKVLFHRDLGKKIHTMEGDFDSTSEKVKIKIMHC